MPESRISHIPLRSLCLAGALALASCITEGTRHAAVNRGTGTEVIGIVLHPDGSPAVAARVSLRPSAFLSHPAEIDTVGSGPVSDTATTTDTITDNQGRFTLQEVPKGDYSVMTRDGDSRALLMRFHIDANNGKLTLPSGTLRPVASISGKVAWASGFPYHKVFVQVYGLDFWTAVDSAGGYLLKGLPAGNLTLRFESNVSAYFQSAESEIDLQPAQDKALNAVQLVAKDLGSRIFHVDTLGSDSSGDGSANLPWRTLAYAARHIPSSFNHTLAIGPGTFRETQAVNLPAGVNLVGQGTDQSVIASDLYNQQLIRLVDSVPVAGNQVLSGFKVDGMSKQLKIGIEVKGRHNVVIHDVEIFATREQGMHIVSDDLPSPPAVYLRGIEVHHCRFRDCAMEAPAFGAVTGSLQLGGLEDAFIHDLNIAESEGRGIYSAWAGHLKGLTIRNCTIRTPDSAAHPLSARSIYLQNLSEDCAIFDNDLDNPVELTGGGKGRGLRSVRVYRNRIVSDGADPMPSGVAVDVPDAEISENYIAHARVGVLASARAFSGLLIHHNVVYDAVERNGGAGLRILLDGASAGKVDLINNVFHNAAPGSAQAVGVDIQGRGSLKGLRILNNIFLATDGRSGDVALRVGAEAVPESPVISHNLLSNVAEGSFGALFIGSLKGLPGIEGTGAKPFPYYRPTADTSNLVDTGIPAGLPFLSRNPDIGAYER